MTDQELMQMEVERLNKNLDLIENQLKAYKKVLEQKSTEQGEQLAVLAVKLQTQIKLQNSDTELYGKNSFSATINRQLVNTWIFAIENYGWHVELDFRGDIISDMWIYTKDHREVQHDIYPMKGWKNEERYGREL